jgi:hypothetical protein
MEAIPCPGEAHLPRRLDPFINFFDDVLVCIRLLNDEGLRCIFHNQLRSIRGSLTAVKADRRGTRGI